MIDDKKRYLVWESIDYHDRWGIFQETDSWDEAVAALKKIIGEQNRAIITEFIPLNISDGRADTADKAPLGG